MASDVDIGNLALSHLGDEANVQSIYPPDGTSQAQHLNRFYAIARDATLEMHAWGFATARKSLAQLSEATTTTWAYQYATPSDMIKPLAVFPADADYPTGVGDDDNKQDFLREGSRILTNTPDAQLRYIFRVTDPTQFTPLFVDTFALILASRCAGPIIKGDKGRKVAAAMQAEAEKLLAHATASDANASSFRPVHQTDWHRARGINLGKSQRATRWGR